MSDGLPKDLDPNTVLLEHRRVMCSLHGEFFRKRWPTGFPIFCVRVFQEVMALDETAKATEAGGLEWPASIHAVLDAKPACCRVTKETLRKLYLECKVGLPGRCSICRRRGLGTEFQMLQAATPYGGDMQPVTYPHVCFDCVLGRMAPVRRN